MGYVKLEGLENAGPGDILGAIAGETTVNPDVLGNIDISGSQAKVEAGGAAAKLARELDGEEVNGKEVSVEMLRGEEEENLDEIDSYVDHYQQLVNLEREEEMRQHRREIENISGKERQSKGRALLHMRGRDEGDALEGQLVKFMRNRKGEELPETEISVGDLVMVSKNDPTRDDNPTGTVTEKTNYSITVAFDETPGFLFSKGLRVDLYVNDVTYQRMEDALEELRNASGALEALRDVLAGIEEPAETREEEVENWFNGDLNGSQRDAVKRALGADDFHLIHGPPGTGKTTTAVEVIQQFVDREKTVIATADSNTAVDNILEFLLDQEVDAVRAGHPARVTPQLREHTLDSLVQEKEKWKKAEELREEAFDLKDEQDELTHPSGRWRRGMSDERIKQAAEEGRGSRGVPEEKIEEMAEWLELQDEINEKFERADELRDEAVGEVINDADVVCTTNSTAGSELMDARKFDVAVIDEATQATEPSCAIPITRAEKVVMAGDHRQLPPTVKSQEAADRGLEKTMFERLAENHLEKKSLLKTQYRMHRDIMEFSSEEFYSGELDAPEEIATHTLEDLEIDLSGIEDRSDALRPREPVVFVDTAGIDAEERTPAGSTSKENPREAEIVSSLAEELLEAGLEEEEIAVISPYDDQVDLLSRKLDYEDLEVDTVDGFQGREKQAVLISLVRSNPEDSIGFLEDTRRLNVALTRAKRKLVVVGDSSTVASHDTYRSFIDYVKERGLAQEAETG